MSNGSLLIVNLQNEDAKMYRCTAKNRYFKLSKLVRHTLRIVDTQTPKNPMFLPKLQNDTIIIPNGSPLRLYCATTIDNLIHWTFTPRATPTKENPLTVQKPNELKIDSTAEKEHDGIYKCWSGTEYQVRNSRRRRRRKKKATRIRDNR